MRTFDFFAFGLGWMSGLAIAVVIVLVAAEL
jgi:hypothetical protein